MSVGIRRCHRSEMLAQKLDRQRQWPAVRACLGGQVDRNKLGWMGRSPNGIGVEAGKRRLQHKAVKQPPVAAHELQARSPIAMWPSAPPILLDDLWADALRQSDA